MQITSIEEITQTYTNLKQRLTTLNDALSEAQFYGKPDDRTWSVAQCIAHVNTAGQQLVPNIKKAVNRAYRKEKYGDPPYSLTLRDRMFIKLLTPGSGVKMPAPGSYRPPEAKPSRQKTVNEFLELQDTMIDSARTASGLNWKRIIISSPVTHLLRLSLGGWMLATAVHEQRHLLQAEKLTKQSDFPE